MASKFRDTFYYTPASSTTQNIPRYVEDKVRQLWPASAKMTAMVAEGSVKNGEFTEAPGKIAKKSVDNIRFECYSYTPLAVTVTAGTGTPLSSTTLTLLDTTELVPPYTLVNTANGTTARVDSRTSDTVVEVTSYGATSFAVSAGDVLLVMAPAYHQGSVDPIAIWKDEDNLYNLTQIVRFPVSITGTAKANVSYFGDYWQRMHKIGFQEGKRKIEGTMLFGNRASSGNTTGAGAVYGAFSSTRGAYQWAVGNATFDCANSFTPDKWRTDVPAYYAANTANTVGDSSPMVMFCGNKVAGLMQGWVNMVQRIDMGGGEVDVFGLKARKFQTATFTALVITHDLFNRGSFANQALLFNPEELFYAFLKGRDVKPNNNIQSPSRDGYMDEIMGEFGLGVRDGGASMLRLTNLYALNS
jgi:hypothetical protein